MNVEEYYNDLKQDVLARSESNENFTVAVFSEYMAERLETVGEVESFDYCHFHRRGIHVDGYSFVEQENLLNLFVSDYISADTPKSINRTEAISVFNRLESFFCRSLDSKFHEEMEESSDGFKLAYDIHDRVGSFDKVRFYLLTNRIISSKFKLIENKKIDDYEASFHIWDISRLFRIESSGKEREDVVIDFEETFGETIPCLPAHLETGAYKSFLAVMPAGILADLYDTYGQRLLEQNVRTFLQFRGNVNKGMRTTILGSPEMFFAYNNGITATAEEVVVEDNGEGKQLRKIVNLQIVNGGQTTASIFTAKKKDKAELNQIFVQMKLSVIDKEKFEEVVPKISEYANSQNKVNAADFFSNHPFHIRMEEFSRRLWAPSSEGTQMETHWYYERARGQYLTAQSDLTPGEKKKFLIQNPRNQMFSKTDLAKYENTWKGVPHIVSLGAQKNFAKFAHEIGNAWDKDPKKFNELYFRHLVAKAILFRRTEKLVMQQPWYQGGYRANIVTYTLALLAKKVEETGNVMSFDEIWKKQELSPETEKQIEVFSLAVHDVIIDTPEGITNVTEWCKKEQCWKNIQGLEVDLNLMFNLELQFKEAAKDVENDAKKTQQIDDGIKAQRTVVDYGKDSWIQLNSWNLMKNVLSPKEVSILKVATMMPSKIPSPSQSVVLLKAFEKAKGDGFSFSDL